MQAYVHPAQTRFCCARDGNLTVDLGSADSRLEYLAGDDGIVEGGECLHNLYYTYIS